MPDFEVAIDAYIARELDRRVSSRVAEDYAMLRRFYFDHVDDPEREAPFLQRLGRGD